MRFFFPLFFLTISLFPLLKPVPPNTTFPTPVSLKQLSYHDLLNIPRVGPITAERILQNQSIDSHLVKGIGLKTETHLRKYILTP